VALRGRHARSAGFQDLLGPVNRMILVSNIIKNEMIMKKKKKRKRKSEKNGTGGWGGRIGRLTG
jgi:hypothetical protein